MKFQNTGQWSQKSMPMRQLIKFKGVKENNKVKGQFNSINEDSFI